MKRRGVCLKSQRKTLGKLTSFLFHAQKVASRHQHPGYQHTCIYEGEVKDCTKTDLNKGPYDCLESRQGWGVWPWKSRQGDDQQVK